MVTQWCCDTIAANTQPCCMMVNNALAGGIKVAKSSAGGIRRQRTAMIIQPPDLEFGFNSHKSTNIKILP